VGVICPASEAFGPDLAANLSISSSASSKEIASMTGSFSLGASAMDQIKGDLNSNAIKNITVTLSNVRLIELPDSAVFKLLGKHSDSCSKAISFRLKNHQKISIIKSVIQADASYRVAFTGGVDAKTRLQITDRLAASMGLHLNGKSEDTFQANDLYWGVRDDESLAAVLSSPSPPATGTMEHERVLTPGKSARILPNVNTAASNQ